MSAHRLPVAGCAGALWFVELDLHAVAALDSQWIVAAIVGAAGQESQREAAPSGLLAYQVASGRANPSGGQLAQAIRPTKGGLNTKLAAIVDQHGQAGAVTLAHGPQHDLRAVTPPLRCLRLTLYLRTHGEGRTRSLLAEPFSPSARAMGEKAVNYEAMIHFACATIVTGQEGLFG